MEKVKLTQEQAEAIEERLKFSHKKHEIVRCTATKGWVGDTPMKDIPLDKIIRALYIGYEVEPEFAVGDWVISKKDKIGIPGQITEFEYDKYWEDNFADYGINSMYRARLSNLRHATPEEIAKEKRRAWWAKHGREVWELKRGDVIEKLCTPIDFEAWEITGTDEHYIYAKGYNKINPKTTQMGANYKVVCFAEDRKDIK